MQFMSQAMGIADCILLAVAPIGAITTVVSAIRVAGPAWLKSFIGRARENLSAAEIEVMSSTSDETCELWNGHSVVRCPGSADIYQFICLLPKGSNLKSLIINVYQQHASNYTSKEMCVVVDRFDDSAPNLLLNCHDRVQRGEIYLAAAFGVILQLGALVYFGFITYNPPIKGQFFLKDGKRIVDYAFPCAAGGTVLLMLGLFICAWVVERSTTETCYEAPNHQMFVVWLQKDHTVNDQVFKPYAIYPTSKRRYITRSRRNTKRPGQQEESKKNMTNVPIVGDKTSTTRDNNAAQEPIWDQRLERITFFGALIALIGFISQFIGMRGLNWTASVVQLAITFVVTMIRVIVRRGLGKSPIGRDLLLNTELDWFSLTLGDL
ncbi:hypothetical protein BBK36DRAFT_1202176, partial [Trichoderma citrinoviride]